MDFRYSRILRIISVVVLSFFVWIFGGLFDVAHAIKNGDKLGVMSDEKETREAQKPEEKFQKSIEDIEQTLADASTDTDTKRTKLRGKKTEIESLDTEIKKQFAETEGKIKDLPEVIKQRHRDFVKKYEDNLTELKGNLDAVDRAKTKGEGDAAVGKTRAHLDRVKPPKRHTPLDPNKLPHRNQKGKEVILEEIKQDLHPSIVENQKDIQQSEDSRQSKDSSQYTVLSSQGKTESYELSDISHEPILVAANGPLNGLVESLPATPYTLYATVSSSAQPQPTDADLAENGMEIVFTPAIRAKAEELGKNPVKIYNWVRNNIEYVPTYGSIQGADMCLQTKQCNDMDAASLLISLLRVSGIYSHYAQATIQLPIDKIMNWVGGSADPMSALDLMSSGGIPVTGLTSSGRITAAKISHVYVEAWIDYVPSRGAVHKQGDTWIPLDASYKQYEYRNGMDMYAQMGFSADQFLQEYLTDIRDITAYQDYGMRMIEFIDANLSDAMIEDVFGASEINSSKTIVMEEFSYLMGTMPYQIITKAERFSAVSASRRYAVTIQIEGDSLLGSTLGLSYTNVLTYLVDKRMTISYEPATSSDEALVSQYGGEILSVPPYLLNVKPVLRMAGKIVATGGSIGLGQDQNIIIEFSGPDGATDRIQNVITAGLYSAIILQSGNVSVATSTKALSTLINNSKNLASPGLTLDDLLGQMLYTIGLHYFQKQGIENDVYAKSLQLVRVGQISEAMVTHGVELKYLFGRPIGISEGGINIDVDRNINCTCPLMRDNDRQKAFMVLSGLSSSAWENRILEAFVDVPSVSAVRLLKLASEQMTPIYTIVSSNLNEILPQLQIGSDIKSDIVNAVNAGKKVIVSKTNVTSNGWTGVGYIALDPTTGAAVYMISGGLSGGNSGLLPVSLRRTPQFTYDYWKTIWIRSKALRFARAYIGTPYVWGGKTEDPGFDCSGLVHDVYDGVDSNFPKGSAKTQYQYCESKGWLRPWDERLEGEIVWRSDLGHVGIEAGINTINWPPDTTTSFTGETVVHASGKPCGGKNSCVPDDQCYGGNPPCGKFKRVIESPLSLDPKTKGASFFGSPADNVCSPR